MKSSKNSHVIVSEVNKYPALKLKKDTDVLHLYLNGEIRILTPSEYKRIREAIPKDIHKTVLDVLLITGMRYVEMLRLYENQLWYNEKRNIIHLLEEAQLKHKRRQLKRTIHPLPSMFHYIMKDFFEGRHPPVESNWNRGLRKWAESTGIAPYGVSAKTTRKTIESWQIAAGVLESTVCLRAGHDSLTSMRHYQGLCFSDEELRDIKKQLNDWGMLR